MEYGQWRRSLFYRKGIDLQHHLCYPWQPKPQGVAYDAIGTMPLALAPFSSISVTITSRTPPEAYKATCINNLITFLLINQYVLELGMG